MTNSSPPKRATRSPGPASATRRAATSARMPVADGVAVLVVDRLEAGPGRRRAARSPAPSVEVRRRASNRAPRLARPVRRSVWARRCSCSSRRRSSVTSRPCSRSRRAARRRPAARCSAWHPPPFAVPGQPVGLLRVRGAAGHGALDRVLGQHHVLGRDVDVPEPLSAQVVGGPAGELLQRRLASRMRPAPSMMQTSASVASTNASSRPSSSRARVERADVATSRNHLVCHRCGVRHSGATAQDCTAHPGLRRTDTGSASKIPANGRQHARSPRPGSGSRCSPRRRGVERRRVRHVLGVLAGPALDQVGVRDGQAAHGDGLGVRVAR